MAVSTAIHDITVLLRDLLLAQLTDPVSHTGNQKFVMTSYPQRPVKYPIVTVSQLSFSDIQPQMGCSSLGKFSRLT